MALLFVALTSAGIWLYLLLWRHGFWRADQKLDAAPADRAGPWPAITAIMPARNEAPTVARALTSLLEQDYPGHLAIILVDDESDDDTGEIARTLARQNARPQRALEVITGAPPPAGWSGKVWAMNQGAAQAPNADFIWFTDADIVHGAGTLRRLVQKAEQEQRDMVSLMVRLSTRYRAEKLLIPAFVFFFQKLYPFAAVNNEKSDVAAAAGGCMLVRAATLRKAGGVAAIRNQLIDDCALARAIRDAGGCLWLGLATDSESIRAYKSMDGIWRMVARTAFTQLNHSWLLLAGTLGGMTLTYLAGPLIAVSWSWHGNAAAAGLGALAWALMTGAYLPTLRDYGVSRSWAAALPIIATLYGAMTVDSAYRHATGQGGAWKSRTYSH